VRSAVTALLVVLCATGLGLWGVGPASAQTEPRRVLVYGDSLSWEARFEIERAIEARLPGWDAIVNTIPGVATCDLLPAMRSDGNKNAGVVVLEFVGVALTPCMQHRDAVTADQEDLDLAIELWSARGVPVVNVAAPRRVDLPRDLDTVGTIYRDTAARTGQHFVDTGALFRNPWTGVYEHLRPCLAGEGADQGCRADGTIETRDVNTGTHFCPISSDATTCPIYSSGIVRYAAAIAATVARAAGGAPAPLPSVPDSSAIRDLAAGLFSGRGGGAARIPPSAQAIADAAVVPAELVPPDIPPREVPTTTGPPDALNGARCRAIRRAVARLDVAAQADAAFAAVDDSASVTQMVRVMPTIRRARDVTRAYRGANAEACLSAVFGGPVTIEREVGWGDDGLRFGVGGLRNLDVVVVRSGRAVTALTFANAAGPPPSASVDAIVGAAAQRLDAAVRADGAR